MVDMVDRHSFFKLRTRTDQLPAQPADLFISKSRVKSYGLYRTFPIQDKRHIVHRAHSHSVHSSIRHRICHCIGISVQKSFYTITLSQTGSRRK